MARGLAQRLRIPLIDKDDVKDHILGLPHANELAYAVMWQIVETQLALKLSVIAVSPLAYPVGYERAMQIATKYHANLLVLETILDEIEWRRRLDARKPGYSSHKISGWAAMQELLRQYDGCWQYPIAAKHHLALDAAQPVNALVNAAVERLTQKDSRA